MVYFKMSAVLKRLIDGSVSVDAFKEFLKTGKCLEPFANNDGADQINPITEFVPYFLNYIRQESSHHFTSDHPVISPKKMKKKKKMPCHLSSGTSNESASSSARNSLFSAPPSSNLGGINLSPVTGCLLDKVVISPEGLSSANHQSPDHSSHGSGERDNSQVTSTPVKFNLDEDFPPFNMPNSSKRKSSTPTRRITPTPARTSYTRKSSSLFSTNSTFDSCRDSERSFSSFTSEKSKYCQKFSNAVNFVGSSSPKNIRRNSTKLKLEDFMGQGLKERVKSLGGRKQDSFYLNTPTDSENSNECNVSQNNLLNKSNSEEVCEKRTNLQRTIPRKEHVTQAHTLKILADAHSFCIQENLVPNVVVEMCFILQLLTVQEEDKKTVLPINSGVLKSIHNCVYYAVLVLEKLVRIIKLLDKGTLRLLSDNPRVNEFSTGLREELRDAYSTISVKKVPYSLVKSPLNSVPFQASVDNRHNFSNDQAFHCFKRQRDTFYEVVREWEESRSKPGWSLQEKLGKKIRYIVHQKPGLENHLYFARLFQSQLIQMCCYENTLPTSNEGESSEFIGNLLKSNPEKFYRLQQRLVAPLSTTAGPCPSPGFTETEEFFREFIVSAMCPSFNRYLMDSFIAKIIELNDTRLPDGMDNSIPKQMNKDDSDKLQVKFASCLITLKTLAKFLGYLVFSPYHLSAELPPAVKSISITARNQVSPQLNVMFYLKKAQEERRLVLTLPWVIEYLSMLDRTGSCLDYYCEVFHFLNHIYRVTLQQNASFCMNRNSLMLSAGLGWLFEILLIPETIFSKTLERPHDSDKMFSTLTFDSLDLVDQHLLYTCCPYLGELRSILAEAAIGNATKRGSVKKIKPICTDKVEVSSSPCRLLQTQMEDNFFRNQPEFLKKVVDFVVARIYHNMVSLVKNSIIPSQLKGVQTQLTTDSSPDVKDWSYIGKEEFKEKNKGLILKLTNKAIDGALLGISNEVDKECKKRSFDAVRSLTPSDMNEVVVKTAARIVHQSTMGKLMEWSHQNLPGIIEKGIKDDIDEMITRENNLPLNNYRMQAEDAENPFNWFYRQLYEKTKGSDGRSVMKTAGIVTGKINEQCLYLVEKGKRSDSENLPTASTTIATNETQEKCHTEVTVPEKSRTQVTDDG